MPTEMELTTLFLIFSCCEAKNGKFTINQELDNENKSIGLLDLFFWISLYFLSFLLWGLMDLV